MQEEVFWCAFHYLVDVELPFGAGADERHGAAEDVVELRYLVEAHFAHEAAEGCDAWVVVFGECGACLLGVDVHGAEFVHLEGASEVAYAFLCVEDGARRGGFDDDGGDEVDGGEDDHGDEGDDYVEDALEGVLPLGHEAVVDYDEGSVEDGVLVYGADGDVARVGRNLYYYVAA